MIASGILKSIIGAIVIISFVLGLCFLQRYMLYRTSFSWRQLGETLAPFEEILKDAGCDLVSVAKSKTFFSKRDVYCGITYSTSYRIKKTPFKFSSKLCSIQISHLGGYNPNIAEIFFKLGSVYPTIAKVEFSFKLQNEVQCYIVINPFNKSVHFSSFDYVNRIKYFNSSQELFDYIQDQMILNLFS
jgi:hypothetical protein